MSGEPVKLVVATRGDLFRDNLVEYLEEQLERAKAGKFDGALCIFERTDVDSLEWKFIGTESLSRLLGRLELLKHAAIKAHEAE